MKASKKAHSEWMSTKEAADFLGISVVTLRRWDTQGKLPSARSGPYKHRKYQRTDLLNFMRQQESFQLEKGLNTFVFDFDSTLFPEESLDEVLIHMLADDPTVKEKTEQIASLCRDGMEGRIPFSTSLEKRLSLATPNTHEIAAYIKKSSHKIEPFIYEALRFLKKKQQKVLVVSGGFKEWIVPLLAPLDITDQQIYANQFLWKQNTYHGIFKSNPLAQDQGKVQLMHQLHTAGQCPGKTVFFGDGMSDLNVYKHQEADIFIGCGWYAVRETVAAQAPLFLKKKTDLLPFLSSLF